MTVQTPFFPPHVDTGRAGLAFLAGYLGAAGGITKEPLTCDELRTIAVECAELLERTLLKDLGVKFDGDQLHIERKDSRK